MEKMEHDAENNNHSAKETFMQMMTDCVCKSLVKVTAYDEATSTMTIQSRDGPVASKYLILSDLVVESINE